MPTNTLHRCLRIVTLACLGLVTTVITAWICTLRNQMQENSTSELVSCMWKPPASSIEGRLSSQRNFCFGSARYSVMVLQADESWPDHLPLVSEQQVRAFVPRWSRSNLFDWVEAQSSWPLGPFTVQGVDAQGWPFQALWCAYAWSPETEPDLWYWIPHGGGIELGDGLMPTEPADWWPRAALPCLPIWSGIAGDTAFYVGVWWSLLTGRNYVRNQRRRRRGRCIYCKYDLRETAPGCACPECGGRDTERAGWVSVDFDSRGFRACW